LHAVLRNTATRKATIQPIHTGVIPYQKKPQCTPRIMSPTNPHAYKKEYDPGTNQLALIGPKQLFGRTTFALVPLPGQKIPRRTQILQCIPHSIDKDMAQRACQIYCTKNHLLNETYNKLRQGELIRTLIHGSTGVGKNFLACALPQESGYPYTIVEIAAPSLLSPWHNCQYAGTKDILDQTIKHYRSSGKKIILILDNIDALEDKDKSVFCVVPCYPWSDALHEFFDRQDSGEQEACNISIITLTDNLDYIAEPIKQRFKQILLEKPDKETRHAIIMAFIAKHNHELDSSVHNYTQKLASMTDGLTPREIEFIFSGASDKLLYPKIPNRKITWSSIEEETNHYTSN
jgi:hypothetical protein